MKTKNIRMSIIIRDLDDVFDEKGKLLNAIADAPINDSFKWLEQEFPEIKSQMADISIDPRLEAAQSQALAGMSERASTLKSRAQRQLVADGKWEGLNHRSGGGYALKYLCELELIGRRRKGYYYITNRGLELVQNPDGQKIVFDEIKKLANEYRKLYNEKHIHIKKEIKKDDDNTITVEFNEMKIEGTPEECARFVKSML